MIPRSHLHYPTLEQKLVIKLIFRCLIPLVILVSGVVVFSVRLSVWSALLGIPMVIIGMVLAIYTYDEVVRDKLDVPPFSDTEQENY